jgi:hypothetical protein
MRTPEIWTIENQTISYYYFRYGVSLLNMNVGQLCSLMGTTVNSMKMMCSNYEFMIRGEGLSDFKKSQEMVYEKYHKHNQQQLSLVVKDIIWKLQVKQQLISMGKNPDKFLKN